MFTDMEDRLCDCGGHYSLIYKTDAIGVFECNSCHKKAWTVGPSVYLQRHSEETKKPPLD